MAAGEPLIFFDGVCNYCNAIVNFVIRQDKKKVFRFAALQSKAGQDLLQRWNLPAEKFESFLLLKNGKLYDKSTAGLLVLGQLPWYWQWMQILWIVPKFLRDAVYGLIARNRYRWFGKKEKCMMPSQEVRERFL